MILQLLKLILQIFGVALEERKKAAQENQKYELDETNMLHIAVSAIQRMRDKNAFENTQVKSLEEKIEATSKSPRSECEEESCRNRSES